MKRDTATREAKLARERSEFRKLIARNPDHFFKVKKEAAGLAGPPVGNTSFEELVCVGYQPSLKHLEATVHIKLSNGFSGDLCGAGSTEFVQFYIDYNDGNGWQDIGYAAFNSHDIPNFLDCEGDSDKPLSYVVTLPLDPETDCCNRPVLPKVRAILSWETLPTGPEDPVVWGNGLDRHIQIKPEGLCFLTAVAAAFPDLVNVSDLPLSLKYLAEKPLDLPPAPEFELPDLVKLYTEPTKTKKGKATTTIVEPHRFGLKNMLSALNVGTFSPLMMAQKIEEWQKLELDWVKAVTELEDTSGNTSYEELDCLGLDPNGDALVATYRIKRSTGYSGDLCSDGSKEYIAFWADWEDTCNWTHLATVEVPAYDIASIPADGLHYAAVHRVDLKALLESCEEPKIGRLRAVLSWNTPPSSSDPDAVPYWGNRVDTHVHIRPGDGIEGPHLSIIGGIGVAEIDHLSSGMTLPGARFALTGAFADSWLTTRSCPFGGQVVIQGPPILGSRYRIMVRTVGGGVEQPVTNKIRTVDEYGVGTWRYADADQAFMFLSNSENLLDLLAWWTPGGNDKWEVRLQIIDGAANEVGTSPWYRVQLDNGAPDAELTLDAGACFNFEPGDTVNGHFVARDPGGHFGAFRLRTLPTSVSPNNPSTATPQTSQTATSPGDSWTLSTVGMVPCGYVLELDVWDRTIRNSTQGHHNHRRADVGFCLLEPEGGS